MNQPGYLKKLVELGGLVVEIEGGEVVGRMVKEETARKRRNPWQFKINPKTDCWEWLRSITPKGYGYFETGNDTRAHRAYYKAFRGDIPQNLQLDHLCRTRSCVNPAHLDVVSSKENTMRGVGDAARNARKTHCKRGHEFKGTNLRIAPRGEGAKRICITCSRAGQRRRYRSKGDK